MNMIFLCWTLSLTLMTALTSTAAPPRRIVTGEAVEQFDTLSTRSDGTRIGIGTNKAESSMIQTQFYGSIIAFIFIILSKIIDWVWMARKDSTKDLREIKETHLTQTLKLQSLEDSDREILEKLEKILAGQLTDGDVQRLIRTELEFLMRAKDFIEIPNRRAGAKDG